MKTPFNKPSLQLAAVTLIICYFAFFHQAGALGLVGPDEPRYASIARAMAESGDWVTPRLNGKPWFEKPVLYYWLAAAAFKVFGVNEAAARLPSALLATCAVLAIAFLARRIYGQATAMAVAMILPTTVGMIGFARAATTDMALSALLAMSMIAAYRALESRGAWPQQSATGESAKLWLATLGALLGLATLAKGPAAVLLAGASALVWAAVAKRWRDAIALLHPVALIAFVVVALPWYVLCAMRNPEFVQVFLISHNVDRFLTPVFQHQQPFWFYAPILLIGLLPWTALLLFFFPQLREKMQTSKWRTSNGLFFTCWILTPLLFFSISKSKLPGYILPIFFPLGLLLAKQADEAIENAKWRQQMTFALLGSFPLFAALVLGNQLAKPGINFEFEGPAYAALVLAAAFSLLIFALALRKMCQAVVVTVCVMIALLLAIANQLVIPIVDSQISSRTVSRAALAASSDIKTYKLHRAWQFGLDFYAHREVPLWAPADPEPAVLVTSLEGFAELEKLGRIRLGNAKFFSPRAVLVFFKRDGPSEQGRP